MFSLGCLIFSCVMKGGYLSGHPRVRDANIEDSKFDLYIIVGMRELYVPILKLFNHISN